MCVTSRRTSLLCHEPQSLLSCYLPCKQANFLPDVLSFPSSLQVEVEHKGILRTDISNQLLWRCALKYRRTCMHMPVGSNLERVYTVWYCRKVGSADPLTHTHATPWHWPETDLLEVVIAWDGTVAPSACVLLVAKIIKWQWELCVSLQNTMERDDPNSSINRCTTCT
jgi:hypothetical protein